MVLTWILISCNTNTQHNGITEIAFSKSVPLAYAKNFKIWESAESVDVTVYTGNDSIEYAFVQPGANYTDENQNKILVEVPVSRLVVTSTSHIPFLTMLDASNALVGFPNLDYISSAAIRNRIDMGQVKDVGAANGINHEMLIELNPELVITYISGPDRGELDQLEQSKIPYVINLDFLEESPLGRSEWIKFVGLLIGKYEMADSVFRNIERHYLELLQHKSDLARKPTVFSGVMYGDTWFVPGGKSFVAQFIEDAGGVYSWSDLNQSGSAELSFEAVLDRNTATEFWIGAGGYTTRQDILQADTRYSNFDAFTNDQVFNYHGRIGATGGFEYLELGGARPDLVLADFIKILNPKAIPEYELYFFKKLD